MVANAPAIYVHRGVLYMSGALYAADPGSIPDESNALFLKFEFRHLSGRIMDGYSHLSEGRIGLHTYIKTLRKSLSKLWTIFT